jgi:hypothetical protein
MHFRPLRDCVVVPPVQERNWTDCLHRIPTGASAAGPGPT